jgi:hypothetical protein
MAEMILSARFCQRNDALYFQNLLVAHVLYPVDRSAVESASAMAICVIAVVGDAPCQCFSPGMRGLITART